MQIILMGSKMDSTYYASIMVNYDQLQEQFNLLQGKEQKDRLYYMAGQIPEEVNDIVEDDKVLPLYFVLLNAEFNCEFLKHRIKNNPIKEHPDKLYINAKKYISDAKKALLELGENNENVALLDSIIVKPTSKKHYYDEWVAAYTKILLEAGYKKTIINKTIMPLIKRIIKKST